MIVAGDRLEFVDGVSVVSDAQARPLILGVAGTQVTVSFNRNGTKWESKGAVLFSRYAITGSVYHWFEVVVLHAATIFEASGR
jgi:hypothetical protein